MKDKTPDALAVYQDNLKRIAAETRAKGATPVLITSMERKAGVKGPTLADYPRAVRSVSKEQHIALLDLEPMSLRLYKALGTNLDAAFQDGTHHNNYGSYELARCVAAGIFAAGIDLGSFVVDGARTFDPAHPDAVQNFGVPPSPVRAARKPDGD